MTKISKGEQKIASIFSRARLNYKREVSFSDLKGATRPLRFDFAVYDSKGNLKFLLDFDGQQHFQYTPFYHKSKIDFRKQLEYDMRKNKYCLQHKIIFLRVPYWDLEDLTLHSILTNPLYRVKIKEHNIMLMQHQG